MTDVAVASTSQIAADAGARIAEQGGNAVDAAVAAALVTACTEPGVCGLGAGGYVTIWSPTGGPATIDGNIEMPGRGLAAERLGQGGVQVQLAYGGGVETVVGPGSVGTPGALAAMGMASAKFGQVPWRELVEPAAEHARHGFPLPQACYNYLVHSGEIIFGRNPDSYRALHDGSGKLKQPGDPIMVPGLADTLDAIAHHGTEEFYQGELAARIAAHVSGGGGILTRRDLAAYQAVARPALDRRLRDWHVATNPPPAIGGATLIAMLILVDADPFEAWSTDEVERLIRIQESVMRFRFARLDLAEDRKAEARRMLALCERRDIDALLTAPSTVHTSAVDSQGTACSITLSAGYGSGEIPAGTGIWLNNCLGELELNRRGLNAGPPGTRLPSNMAPTVARRDDGAVLAIGSPGADRITTAILQTLINFVYLGMSLQEAIDHPRAHVELNPEGLCVAFERGLPVNRLPVPQRTFEELSMFFGGVGAALWSPGKGFVLGADTRRTGGTRVIRQAEEDS